MTRRFRRPMRSLAAVLFVVLLAAACSSDGFPQSYDDQPDAETGLSNVEMNWLEGCEVQLDEEQAENANAICGCAFSRIKSDIPFDAFVEVNNKLSDDPRSLSELANSDATARQLVDTIKNCIADA